MSAKDRIVLLSQDAQIHELVHSALQGDRVIIIQVERNKMLRSILERSASIIILDLNLPEPNVTQTAELLNQYLDCPVLLLCPQTGQNERGLKIWHTTANDRPLEKTVNLPTDENKLKHHLKELLHKGRFLRGDTFVGLSSPIRRLRAQILRVASTPVSTVLLIGETGAGKDVVAKALHDYSERSNSPFIPVNCAAIPENLLESELFGHERGAFTDAKNQRRGLFERANGGTVFLDEIGEMSQGAQIRLLRVLEQREVTRIGSSDTIAVDIRVVAATNKSLQEAVGQNEFRLDLYHRLKVVTLEIPPLRDRTEDIPLLIKHFSDSFNGSRNNEFHGLTQAALELLNHYHWPGNVRELRNLVESLTFLGPQRPVEPKDLTPLLEDSPLIDRHLPIPANRSPENSERELIYFALLDLKREIAEVRRLLEDQHTNVPSPPVYQLEASIHQEQDINYDGPKAVEPLQTLKELEQEAIETALARVGGNRKQAASILGISPRTLYRKLDEYGLR